MAIVYNISAMETPTFRPRPRGGETSPAGPDAPAFRPRPRGGQAGSPPPATTGEKQGNLLGRMFGRHRGERQPAREQANPLDREPAPAAPEPALTPEKGQQWYQRLGQMSRGMAVNWAKNLDPRGKDKAWILGMSFGAGIGVGANLLVAPGVDRLILSGAKFAASQSVYAVIKGGYALEKSRLNRLVTGEDLSRRLEEIEKRRSRALKLIGNFMLGMSAGATYTSLTGAGLGLAEQFLGARLPDVGAMAEKVVNKVKEAKMPEVGMPEIKLEVPDVGAGIRGVADDLGDKIQELTGGKSPVTPDAAAGAGQTAQGAGETLVQTKEVLETLTQTKEYQDSIAAAVGNRLDLTDQAVNEAIKGMGVDPAKVSKQAFEHARQLVQNEMELQANYSFNPANHNINYDDLSNRPIPLAVLKETFARDFDSYISQPDIIHYGQSIALGDLRQSLLTEMVSSEPFKQKVAAAVGAHLDTVANNTINEVLQTRGLDPSKLSPEALQKIHEALRHQMENYANFQFDNAADIAVRRDILDTQVVAAEGNKLFADFLSSQAAHDRLVEVASKTLNENTPFDLDQFVTGNIQQALSSLSPADLTEKVIPGNTTVGHMLFEAGVQTGWGADQAQLFGAEIAANHELLSAAWAANEHTPFPIQLSDLDSLIERAQNGDVEALKKLKNALHWVPAGARLKILSKAGVSAVLAAFSKG